MLRSFLSEAILDGALPYRNGVGMACAETATIKAWEFGANRRGRAGLLWSRDGATILGSELKKEAPMGASKYCSGKSLRLVADRQRGALQRRRVQAVLRGRVGAGLERRLLHRLHLGAGLPVSADIGRGIHRDGANRERASANGDTAACVPPQLLPTCAAVATRSKQTWRVTARCEGSDTLSRQGRATLGLVGHWSRCLRPAFLLAQSNDGISRRAPPAVAAAPLPAPPTALPLALNQLGDGSKWS